ncbi:MAG: hypothetical protein GTO45_29995 [Candidatus Aminicenantes bacterium]|nr:hypothetical protein [Candidatus Aminicenantes bacterium]NIM83016.1 hypothetical protein [Candidatus Aminicenantes bacterium]NIN22402.1 hypothetical protein [Candidatus Aminicenantes bacterium]NIN46170.1 hypothetical protein [Candidatus Aminicenantes bacterium]NIN89008.1 hypothetical protein [Candidatus Aminicenantes bacterium]
MKTHKTIKKLRFSKETIANLNVSEMGHIYGGGFDQDQGAEIPAQPYTDSCNPCQLPGEPIYPETHTCNSTCGGPINNYPA